MNKRYQPSSDHSRSVEQVLEAMEVELRRGLTEQDVRRRRLFKHADSLAAPADSINVPLHPAAAVERTCGGFHHSSLRHGIAGHPTRNRWRAGTVRAAVFPI